MITLTSKLTLGPAENARPVITGVSAYVSLQSEDQSVLIRLPRFQHSKVMNGRQQPWARTHTASFMLRPQVQDQAAKGGKLFREKRSSDTALQAQRAKRLQLVVSLPQTDFKKRGNSVPVQHPTPPQPLQPLTRKLSLWPHSSAPLAPGSRSSTKQHPRKPGWMHGFSLTDPLLRLSLT